MKNGRFSVGFRFIVAPALADLDLSMRFLECTRSKIHDECESRSRRYCFVHYSSTTLRAGVFTIVKKSPRFTPRELGSGEIDRSMVVRTMTMTQWEMFSRETPLYSPCLFIAFFLSISCSPSRAVFFPLVPSTIGAVFIFPNLSFDFPLFFFFPSMPLQTC